MYRNTGFPYLNISQYAFWHIVAPLFGIPAKPDFFQLCFTLLLVTSHTNCLLHIDLMNIAYLTACAFIRSSWRCIFEWRHQWHWIGTKIDNNVILATLKSETTCKLINRIPGLRLLISSLPGKASRMLVESRGLPKDTHLIFSMYTIS